MPKKIIVRITDKLTEEFVGENIEFRFVKGALNIFDGEGKVIAAIKEWMYVRYSE